MKDNKNRQKNRTRMPKETSLVNCIVRADMLKIKTILIGLMVCLCLNKVTHTHTHTHICVCVFVCVLNSTYASLVS